MSEAQGKRTAEPADPESQEMLSFMGQRCWSSGRSRAFVSVSPADRPRGCGSVAFPGVHLPRRHLGEGVSGSSPGMRLREGEKRTGVGRLIPFTLIRGHRHGSNWSEDRVRVGWRGDDLLSLQVEDV